jgi:hypothetical protein
MRTIMLAAIVVLFGASLHAAAKGVIQLKDGKVKDAKDIIAETVSGIHWEPADGSAGVRIYLWDVDTVRYSVNGMDGYNSLARKLAGGAGAALAREAGAVAKLEQPKEFDNDQWARVQLSTSYYLAMASWLESDWDAAVKGLEAYIKKCEEDANIYKKGTIQRVGFTSKISGAKITDGGGLNRYYLDALENLGVAYIRKGDAKSANERAFGPLQALCEALSSTSKNYFDWAMRALRVSADFAVTAKDYAGARECYVSMRAVAISQSGAESRAVYEARLKIGFMQILEGDTRNAQSAFSEAIKQWESGYKDDRSAPPTPDWINPDKAYLTAGCYVGRGLVESTAASKVEDWAEAYENFSLALAVFSSDDEIRSMALLGAAKACSKLAELNKDNKVEVEKGTKTSMEAVASASYALLAEKYLAELTTLLPKTRAAEDESIAGIRKVIEAYRA